MINKRSKLGWLIRASGLILLSEVMLAQPSSALQPKPILQPAEPAKPGHVILLHGLGRSAGSMDELAENLTARGYQVCNIDYPSTTTTISALARDNVVPDIKACQDDTNGQISFVTHSLGGIIVRELIKYELVENVHRVVMLSPPNEGSELVDKLSKYWLFDLFLGPAGNELGTDSKSKPNGLGAAEFELGIVMGTRSINPVGSLLIPGRDDGTVSIESSKLEGMADFIEVPANHAFIMKNPEAIQQVIHFLQHGKFDRPPTLALDSGRL